jgi:D-amino-acid dehydrogenase
MNKRCVVIGAGIVGASCAWHLQRAGMQVTLIDPVAPGQSCSYGNAACIATSGVVPASYPGVIRKVPGWLLNPLGPVSIRMGDFAGLAPWFWKFWRLCNRQKVEEIAAAQASLMHRVMEDFDDLLKAVDAVHLRRSPGAVFVYDSEADFLAGEWQIRLAEKLGFESQRLTSAELKSMLPQLKLDDGVALLVPGWHHVADPGRLTTKIADHCFSNGGDWLQDRVSRVSADAAGIRVYTDSGQTIEAGHLVVAAGAWSNSIAEQLDFKVPLVAERGYHSQLENPGIKLAHPVMSMSRHFVMTPLDNGLRIAGTAEFAALDARPDFRRAKVLLEQAGRYLHGLNAGDATEWMGQRPAMVDSLPVISVSPGHPNVFYAFGHGHYGLTQGPTTGRLIAGMVLGSEPPVDLSPFRLDRFANPRT